jgi:hypothetical protein
MGHFDETGGCTVSRKTWGAGRQIPRPSATPFVKGELDNYFKS